MRALFERLFGGGRGRRPRVTCYLRENGPVAYELDLFTATPRERVEAMLDGGLAWAWTSGVRGWTHLTRVSLSAFLADLPSGTRLIAVEGELPTDLAGRDVAYWIRRFCRLQPVPLAAVIEVSADRQLLFVQQHASDAVNRLMDDWGIDKGATARQAYAHLGRNSLESIAEHL